MIKELVDHFYNETSNQLQSYPGTAYRRQASKVKQHIGNFIQNHGPREASEVLHNLVTFADAYPGGQDNLFMGDIFSAVSELRTAGIESGSVQYKLDLMHMNDNNLLTTADHIVPEAPPIREQQAADSLGEALAYQKDKLARASGLYEVRAIEYTIYQIERDIQSLNPSPIVPQAPDKPQLSPGAQATRQR